MSTGLSGSIRFRVSSELESKIKAKNNFSDWIRMALIERLERERLERLADGSKKESDK